MMKKDNKSLLWGVIAGSVIGTVTALLFAPKPGKELRKDIAEGTVEAVDKVQEIAAQAGEKGSELYGKAKDAVVTVVSEVKEWTKSATEGVEEAEAGAVTVSGIAADEAVEAVEDTVDTEAVSEEDAVAQVLEDGAEAQAEPDTEAAAVVDEETAPDKDGELS
ncbi:YtxH domain-containing protein [Paenibacillus sp. MMS20-IR301]|uniref:YtxH domain-containing protein n=1 Tax=Paenibacillus sp. MMS20-IR301 TaxID=2895946 RepID=UPI0028EA6985|nr:YtxH domain-containing protein [Paenibacillus sp. MMS20-IR301]WNS46202.1 YtxH domain-containing protein [Paenibacillus sp. MMS20-IR301]